jgi:hypothetical protein
MPPHRCLNVAPLAVTLDGPDTATAAITHPSGTRYVSLPTDATDSAGDTVTQTVIRAYPSGSGLGVSSVITWLGPG